MNKNLIIKRMVALCMAGVMIFGFGIKDAHAASKARSWVSKDGKKLYRATVTTSEANSKNIPLSAWQEKKKGIAMSIAVTAGIEQSVSASGSFSGTGSAVLVELTGELGFSASTSVSFTAEHSYSIGANQPSGDYRILLVWPGAKTHGVVTEEPNDYGGGNQVMNNGSNSKLKPKKKVIGDKTISYAPTLTNMKVRLDYRK